MPLSQRNMERIVLSGKDIKKLSKEELIDQLIAARRLCISLENVIEHSADAIYIADGDGTCLKINKAYEKLTGMSREFLVGVNVRDLIGTYISESAGLQVIATRKPVTIEQTFYKTGRTALVSCTPVFDENDKIIMLICNDRDFNEIEALRQKLSHTEDLANKYQAEIAAIKANIFARANIVAEDEKMLALLRKANKIAKVDSTVLVLGDTGTGKEAISKYIHESSRRSKEMFIRVNCGAISEQLLESEFFGYEKGAFTGASETGKMGLFELADKGTLFLDEIGELPQDMQVKLLSVLQDQEFIRVGGTKPIRVDVRIIAATNRDLYEMVQKKQFREDLYYRLNVVSLIIPPLADRPMDIIPLANYFLSQINNKYGFEKKLTSLACQSLRDYSWPGNVRELKNVIEQAVIMCDGNKISADDMPFSVSSKADLVDFAENDIPLEELLAKIEWKYIKETYKIHNSVRGAAKHLGMSPSTFVRKKKLYEEKYDTDE